MPAKRVIRARFDTAQGRKSPVLTLEVVSEPADLAKGLMNRVQMPPHHGMLFVFPEPSQHGFWMKNTYIHLDIAWLDEQGFIINVAHMTPHDETMHRPLVPAKFAVELHAGALARYGVTIGDRLMVLR